MDGHRDNTLILLYALYAGTRWAHDGRVQRLRPYILHLIVSELLLWGVLAVSGSVLAVASVLWNFWPYVVVPLLFVLLTGWQYGRMRHQQQQIVSLIQPFIKATWVNLQDDETRYRWAVKSSPDLSPKQVEQELRRLDRGGDFPRTNAEYRDIRRLDARLEGIQKALRLLVGEMHWHEDGPTLRTAHGGLPSDAPLPDRIAAVLAEADSMDEGEEAE